MMQEKNKQIIAFILAGIPKGLTTIQLIKAIYLSDYIARLYLSHPISSFEYYFHHYGPYDQSYPMLLSQLTQDKVIAEEVFTSALNRTGKSYSLVKEFSYELLDSTDRYILTYIRNFMNEWRNIPVDRLLELVYDTEPMKRAIYRGEALNMDCINNQAEDEGFSLQQIALSEYEYEQGECITLEELKRELQNTDPT